MKKLLLLTSIIATLLLSITPSLVTYAASNDKATAQVNTITSNFDTFDNRAILGVSENVEPFEFKNDIVERQTRAGVAVFVAGIVVAWVVGGVIEYKTGKAPEAWVAIGLKKVETNVKNIMKKGPKQIYVNSTGTASGCYKFPCPIRSLKTV